MKKYILDLLESSNHHSEVVLTKYWSWSTLTFLKPQKFNQRLISLLNTSELVSTIQLSRKSPSITEKFYFVFVNPKYWLWQTSQILTFKIKKISLNPHPITSEIMSTIFASHKPHIVKLQEGSNWRNGSKETKYMVIILGTPLFWGDLLIFASQIDGL